MDDIINGTPTSIASISLSSGARSQSCSVANLNKSCGKKQMAHFVYTLLQSK